LPLEIERSSGIVQESPVRELPLETDRSNQLPAFAAFSAFAA
jgi:hypothetical protein